LILLYYSVFSFIFLVFLTQNHCERKRRVSVRALLPNFNRFR